MAEIKGFAGQAADVTDAMATVDRKIMVAYQLRAACALASTGCERHSYVLSMRHVRDVERGAGPENGPGGLFVTFIHEILEPEGVEVGDATNPNAWKIDAGPCIELSMITSEAIARALVAFFAWAVVNGLVKLHPAPLSNGYAHQWGLFASRVMGHIYRGLSAEQVRRIEVCHRN